VTYNSVKTPLLQAITPRYGNVKGNEVITFTGTNFPTTIIDYSIKIDGITCTVLTATSTEVTCRTGPRPGLHPTTTLDFKIDGYGSVAT
jgi:hypothetical protein